MPRRWNSGLAASADRCERTVSTTSGDGSAGRSVMATAG
jgi:hypothetical protein